MVTTTNTAAHAFVAQHLGETIAAFPETVQQALIDKFVTEYNDPHTTELEFVLRKRLTDDEVRSLLFAPTPAQYRYYADLLSLRASSNDDKEDTTTWQFTLRKRFLTLFYLKHVRNWPLVVEFLLRDGLQILVDLFVHPDLQMQGQAIESFVQITSNPIAFEWFEEPVGYDARVLHTKMIALAAPSATFLPNIIANIRVDDTTIERIPGRTFVLLQILAFFLSWVRKLYTRNELRLSRELLDLLRDWKEQTHSENHDELALAHQVYEDFSRWPAIEDVTDTSTQSKSVQQHIALEARSTSTNVFSTTTVEKLLVENTEDAIERAIALCSEAIDAQCHVVDARVCRATARFQRLRDINGSGRSDNVRLGLEDCRVALELEPGNMSAWRLQLNVLETMEMWVDGRDVLDAWANEQETTSNWYLPDDLNYLTARRAFFDDKTHEQRQRQAQEKRQQATRAAKEQRVYQLLLQRTQEPKVSATTPVAFSTRNNHAKTESTQSLSHNVLARFQSSTTEKKKKPTSSVTVDAPLGHVVKARSLVRKLNHCKHDPLVVRSLLRSYPSPDVMVAMGTALPDASLVAVLEALVERPEEEETQDDAVLTRLLQHLLSLPRFALMREMTTPEQQQHLDTLVMRAKDSRNGLGCLRND